MSDNKPLAPASGSATFDTEHCDNIVCPYCGYEDRDSWEVDFGPGLDGETEYECADCGRMMKAERCCTVTYTTRKLTNHEVSDRRTVAGTKQQPERTGGGSLD